MATEYEYSSTGLALTKSFEGLRLRAYQDVAGIWTVGYGHTGPDVRPGECISEAEAELLLRGDLAHVVEWVNLHAPASMAQSQFDAVVDFGYNCGLANLQTSHLWAFIEHGEWDQAEAQFRLWVYAGKAVQPGLVRRRAAEAALFSGQKIAPNVSGNTVGGADGTRGASAGGGPERRPGTGLPENTRSMA